MALEIERKFLLKDDSWRPSVTRTVALHQGYLGGDDHCSIRVRSDGERAYLNIKSKTLGVTRSEFEYEIPQTDACALLQQFCQGRSLTKRRHYVKVGDHEWEIDEFDGQNQGLVVAEIELDDPDEIFARPPWLGLEVSDDPRYYNSRLIEAPYRTWQASQTA